MPRESPHTFYVGARRTLPSESRGHKTARDSLTLFLRSVEFFNKGEDIMISITLKVFIIMLSSAAIGICARMLGISDDLLLVLCMAAVATIFISGLTTRRRGDYLPGSLE